MSGTLRNVKTYSGRCGEFDPSDTPRSLGNGTNSRASSPLKLFARTKSKSIDIFRRIAEYVLEAEQFLKDTKGEHNKDWENMHSVLGMVNGIIDKLGRNHMKVAFFGRTSNGKSTVINAMLRNKILPSGVGHTTNCFLQIEGTEASEGYLLTDDSTKPKSIHSIKELASALSKERLKQGSVIKILWPKEKYRLLKDDVVFIDSPGIDVTPDLDTWIDKFCLDADVFVFVENAESTLMQTEKNFFHKVSSRLSKPNIFILQNRWDLSVDEEDVDEVKEQHFNRNVQFLTDELKVADKQEAKNRIFFVSAKEALFERIHVDNETPIPDGTLQKNYAERLFEFTNFERAFELCISKSAVETKFQTHLERGKKIVADFKKSMQKTYSECLQNYEDRDIKRKDTDKELKILENLLALLTVEIKDDIKSTVEKVEYKVSIALNEEIKRLSALVDEFSWVFKPDITVVNEYKKELHKHVEEGLGRNLQDSCSSFLHQAVDNAHKKMIERIAALLKDEEKNQLSTALPKRDFKIAYNIDCRNLCSEFQEDIQFYFSLGISSLMHKFLGSQGVKSTLNGGASFVPRPIFSPGTSLTPTSELMQQDNQVLMSVITTLATITSRSTMGGVIVAGLALKLTGWKVVASVGSLYLMLYVYEWLFWTNKAKERRFKSQYVEYAASKLRLIVDLTSSNCSHQVHQELSSTFASLCHYVDLSKDNLKEELVKLDAEIKQLQETSKQSKSLRNKADWLDTELDAFIEEFLQTSNLIQHSVADKDREILATQE